VWWTPEFFSPGTAQPGGHLLRQYVEEFQGRQRQRVVIQPVIKARYGRGGLVNFLRTTGSAAPNLLPDLIVLDAAELEAAAALHLLQPLDPLVDPAVLSRLYPFARLSGQVDGQTLAVLFASDLQHAVFDQEKVPLTPTNWPRLMANHTTYSFPLYGSEGAAVDQLETALPVALSHYLSAGGKIDLTTRRLTLEPEPLTTLAAFYRDGAAGGILPPRATDNARAADSWADFLDGAAPVAEVSARRYMAERAALSRGAYTASPGAGGMAPPVATGWGLAIVARDPARQALAASFINWLLDPVRAGAWAQSAGWLPTQPGAWEIWKADHYTAFLQAQLAAAVPLPVNSDATRFSLILQHVQAAVLQDGVDPHIAVGNVLNSSPEH
jgi:ABC-type glycerol-3-phosphate transport system substrate-binding protein